MKTGIRPYGPSGGPRSVDAACRFRAGDLTSFVTIRDDLHAMVGKSASTPSRSKRGVKPLQFYPRVSGGELPISFGVFLVSISLPGNDFFGQLVLVGNSPVEAL